MTEDNSLVSARFRWHGRFGLPAEHRGARSYYLHDLFVPRSRTESLLTPLARRFETVADLFLGRRESEILPGRTASEWGEIAEVISRSLNRSRSGAEQLPHFLVLTDYAHSNRGQLVVFVFAGSGTEPVAVAKVRTTQIAGKALLAEFETLKTLNANESLRSTLPEPIDLCETISDTVLIESAMPGRSLYFLLRNGRSSVDSTSRHFELAFNWLTRFHKSTFRREICVDELRDRYLMPSLRRLDQFEKLTDEENAAADNLIGEIKRSELQRIPIAAVQGDFWTRNILLGDDEEQIGIIDWEAFEPEGLPTDDAVMFIISYGRGYQWRFGKWEAPSTAFLRMFRSTTSPGSIAMKYLEKFCVDIGIDPRLLTIMIPMFLIQQAARAARAAEVDERKSKEVSEWRTLFRAYTATA